MELITIIHGSGTEWDKKGRALEVTRTTLASLFDALNQEHESYFAGVGTALEIRTALDQRRSDESERAQAPAGAEEPPGPDAPDATTGVVSAGGA